MQDRGFESFDKTLFVAIIFYLFFLFLFFETELRLPSLKVDICFAHLVCTLVISYLNDFSHFTRRYCFGLKVVWIYFLGWIFVNCINAINDLIHILEMSENLEMVQQNSNYNVIIQKIETFLICYLQIEGAYLVPSFSHGIHPCKPVRVIVFFFYVIFELQALNWKWLHLDFIFELWSCFDITMHRWVWQWVRVIVY